MPDFKKLDAFFDISDMECKEFLLKNIKKRISEKIAGYCELIDSIFQPDATLASMHESKFISEKERNAATDIYTSFMKLSRRSNELSVEDVEAENAGFIKEAFDVYSRNKDKLKELLSFLRESWAKKDEIKEEIEYLR